MRSDERFQCLHPDPGKEAPRISADKYHLIRKILLEVIPSGEQGVPFSGLDQRVAQRLTQEQIAGLGSVGWYTTVVKLDLEARGEIERLPGVKPQLIRRIR